MQEGIDYELTNAGEVFDDNNNSYIYGITWFYNGEAIDAQWFKTEEARQKAINEN